MCGEAAGDPLLACVLVGLGVSSLSMAPGLLATARVVLGSHSFERCVQMAAAARSAADGASARAAARELADERALLVL